jgi:L-alanine-DL-glutamate epimerase-like enolase superfamily enzyme
MKIVDVEVELIERPAAPAFRWRHGLPGSEPAHTAGVLRIRTDDGMVGEAHTATTTLVIGNPILPNPEVGPDGMVAAPSAPGLWDPAREDGRTDRHDGTESTTWPRAT